MSHRSIEAFKRLVRAPAVLVCTSEFSEDGPLSVRELEYIAPAVVSRRSDFATGRACAVAALRQLGTEVRSLERSEGRQPVWPHGTLGSITHCEGLCAAAAAWAGEVRFLGIDAEPNVPLKDKVLERISSRAERDGIAAGDGSGFSGKTLFSAKESIFKALYPAVDAYFGFEEVEILFSGGDGLFTASLSAMLQDRTGLKEIEGRYATTLEHTMTVVQVAR
ncbi:MAG: 4'-phosphopantetheinyl transferase superfamily protein [Pseudomonadota bacterium]